MMHRFCIALVLALLTIFSGQLLARADDRVALKILAINDLHGGIDGGRRIGNRPVGGAAILASLMKARALGHANVLIVGAGDMVGASPPISALLQDEPTVRVLNAIGLNVNTPGNHEFDEGIDEFQRLSHGGCHPITGCFEGARFPQISANIVVDATGELLLPPYWIQQVEGVPVAFIGATHSDVPKVVVAGAVDGLSFLDPAIQINTYVAELKAQGVRSIIVLIHEGGAPRRNNGQVGGPFIQTVEALDPEVDVVVSSHTHQGYVARVAGKLVTQAYSYGSAFADIDLTIDRASGDIISSWADIVTAYSTGVTPDPAVAAIVDDAQAHVGPRVARVVGSAARALTADQNREGETSLGNLIADAQRWKTGARIALTNPGGIRAPISAGQVTWGQLFSVQPFANELVTMSFSGYQLASIFELQWTLESDGSERYRPLQTSGLRVTWDGRRPIGERIVSVTLEDGTPLDANAEYRVAVNGFLAGGGDNFWIIAEGFNPQFGLIDLTALVDYVEQLPQPFDARIEGRIRRLD